MLTKRKYGTYKPKAYATDLSMTKSRNVKKSLSNLDWKQYIQYEYNSLLKNKI